MGTIEPKLISLDLSGEVVEESTQLATILSADDPEDVTGAFGVRVAKTGRTECSVSVRQREETQALLRALTRHGENNHGTPLKGPSSAEKIYLAGPD